MPGSVVDLPTQTDDAAPRDAAWRAESSLWSPLAKEVLTSCADLRGAGEHGPPWDDLSFGPSRDVNARFGTEAGTQTVRADTLKPSRCHLAAGDGRSGGSRHGLP